MENFFSTDTYLNILLVLIFLTLVVSLTKLFITIKIEITRKKAEEKELNKTILYMLKVKNGKPFIVKNFSIKEITRNNLYKKEAFIEEENRIMRWDKEIVDNSLEKPTLAHQYVLGKKNKPEFERVLYLPKNNIF